MANHPETPLKRLRVAREMSTHQMAKLIGLHQVTYLRMEWGESKSTKLAEKIAAAIGRHHITEIDLLYPERFPA